MTKKYKICFRCKTKKKLKKFGKNKAAKDGVGTYCLPCKREYYKFYQQLPENQKKLKRKRKLYKQHILKHNPDYWREWKLKKRYQVSLKWYYATLRKQKNRCAICNKKISKFKRGKKTAHVDHDHKTNKVRSLLCIKCNLLLGAVNDKIKILKFAIKYLRFWRKKHADKNKI